MGVKAFLYKIFRDTFYEPKWRCLLCRKEIFDGKYLCEDCEKKMPYNNGPICAHCGRAVKAPEEYCSTCKNTLLKTDMARSVFIYKKPVSKLIQGGKYYNKQYIYCYFAEKLTLLYQKNYINADYFVYVPMTEDAEYKRGFNQSKLLAEKVSEKTGVPVLHCLTKVKDTKRQATLNRKERMSNLVSAFKVTDKKAVRDKVIVLFDDVTTTGSTAEIIAGRLKDAGAKKVVLLTVASTPPIDNY